MSDEVLQNLIALFLLLAAGFVLTKIRLLERKDADRISILLSRVTIPSLYISSLMSQTLSKETALQSVEMIGLAVVYYTFAALVSFGVTFFLRVEEEQRGVYRFLLIFSNAGNMGFPVMRAIIGQEALFYGAVYNIVFNIAVFSLGIFLLRGKKKGNKVDIKAMFLSPAILSICLGLVLFLVSPLLRQTPVYHTVYEGAFYLAVKWMGEATVPLSMFVVGCVLARVNLKRIFGSWRMWVVCAVRLLALPLATSLLFGLFGLPDVMFGVMVLVAGMPSAVFATILSSEHGGDVETASTGVFLSTLLSAATIPVLALLV